MNSVISDTAEYGCYLYSQACEPLLKDFMARQDIDVIGTKFNAGGNGVDNRALNAVNEEIRSHPVEIVGKELREKYEREKPPTASTRCQRAGAAPSAARCRRACGGAPRSARRGWP